MKELFLNKELSILAKEKGFDEPCFAFYHKSGRLQTVNIGIERTKYKEDIDAPLYQQIIDWFRETHGIDLHMNWAGRGHIVDKFGYNYWNCKIYKAQSGLSKHINKTHYYNYEQINGQNVGGQMTPHFDNLSYYQCLDKAIEEAFKLI